MRAVLAALALALLIGVGTPSDAHDSWIASGGHRNGNGEWCCGEHDCFPLDPATVEAHADGYHLLDAPGGKTVEIVPLAESQISQDGAYWRCHRPDGTRRCFFAPPPNS